MRRCLVLLAAGLAAGCTDVVDAGKVVVSPQVVDAGSETLPPPSLEELCVRTGGHVEVHACCGGQDFAPLCSAGPCCGASDPPSAMIDLRQCICPANQCWSPMPVPPNVRAGCWPQVMSSGPDAR